MICFFVSKPFWKVFALLLLIFAVVCLLLLIVTKGWCRGFNDNDLIDIEIFVVFYCFSLFLVVPFWRATRKGTIPWHCWLLKSLLFLFSFIVVSISILRCFYFHSLLFLFSRFFVSIFILCCFYFHSSLFLLSFFVVSIFILCCFYCHSLLLLVAVPQEKGTMPWLGQRQNPD